MSGGTGADGPSSPEADVAALLRRASLSRVADRRIAALSRGALVRLAIAHALLERPRLLLLDGPLDGLEARWRGSVALLLRAVVDDGAACLVTGREYGALARASDRVVALGDGCVESQRSALPAAVRSWAAAGCVEDWRPTPAAARVAERHDEA